MGLCEFPLGSIRTPRRSTPCRHHQHSQSIWINILLWLPRHHLRGESQSINNIFIIEIKSPRLLQVMPNNYIASITLHSNTSFPTIWPYNTCGQACLAKISAANRNAINDHNDDKITAWLWLAHWSFLCRRPSATLFTQ